MTHVETHLTFRDRFGAILVRLGHRNNYRVEPGLYAVGTPNKESPVFVSANYKLSFDRLRQNLTGIDGWILVLDTKGINVWCAAGKGTFGTDELVKRIEDVGLSQRVSHRQLIVPQLGAPGVAAHEVQKRSGFRVVYGPVCASDIPDFLQSGLHATPEMRRVRFPLSDRLALVPLEFILSIQWWLIFVMVMIVASGICRSGFDSRLLVQSAIRIIELSLGACVMGVVVTPMLLPWLPGRAFSVKGALVGATLWLFLILAGIVPCHSMESFAWLCLMTASSSFFGMQFTGCSTFTSESGVRREMRVAIPLQIFGLLIGVGCYIASRLNT